MLCRFIEINRDEIITRCRAAKVATRLVPSHTEIDHGVPLFLDQLVATLRSGGGETKPRNPGGTTEMFRPFEQRSADRTGMGLGLAFSRWGVEANGGSIYARTLPDKGCIITVDLPRVAVPALVPA